MHKSPPHPGSEVIASWLRLHDFAWRLERERDNIVADLQQLSIRFDRALNHCARAGRYLAELASSRETIVQQLSGLEPGCLSYRQQELKLWELDELYQVHQGKARLFVSAAVRIFRVLQWQDAFLEMVGSLHRNARAALEASLALLQFYSSEQDHKHPPPHLLADFRRTLGRLGHPYRVYQEVQGEGPRAPGI